MALYKREKANPASGCLPMVIQIPVFFSLYKVLFVTIEMRHAPFFGWIHDLSAPDPTTVFNLFGLIPWDPCRAAGTAAHRRLAADHGHHDVPAAALNPQPADPMQAKIFMFMPLIFTFMLAQFPAGLVIYWAWNNTLSIIQQWVIMKRMDAGERHQTGRRRERPDAPGKSRDRRAETPTTARRRRGAGARPQAVRPGTATSSPARPGSSSCRTPACPRSPSPAAPTSASPA